MTETEWFEYKNKSGEVFWNSDCEEPMAAIEYALDHISGKYEKIEFLESWYEGDIAPWPNFLILAKSHAENS
jgi:hypothetical protein